MNLVEISRVFRYSILRDDDPERAMVQEKLKAGSLGSENDRAIGAMLCMAIGDALGAPLEFSACVYGSAALQGLEYNEFWTKGGYNRFGLHPGQWTDDASMGFCLADSLLACQGFNA